MNENTLGLLENHSHAEYSLDLITEDGPVSHPNNLPESYVSNEDDFKISDMVTVRNLAKHPLTARYPKGQLKMESVGI